MRTGRGRRIVAANQDVLGTAVTTFAPDISATDLVSSSSTTCESAALTYNPRDAIEIIVYFGNLHRRLRVRPRIKIEKIMASLSVAFQFVYLYVRAISHSS
jgi:hypothetical protein